MAEKQVPVLSAQQMADFMMREYNTNEYRRSNLIFLESIHEKSYVDDVRRLMNAIRSKQKSAKKKTEQK